MSAQTPKQIELRIAAREEERAALSTALERIRELLVKADRRLRESPNEQRRWIATIDNLEMSLLETRASLGRCEQETASLRRQLEHRIGTGAEELLDAESGLRAELKSQFFEQAAHRVLATPIEEIPAMALQEMGLAKAYMERGASAQWDESMRNDLRARVERFQQAMGERRTIFGQGAKGEAYRRHQLHLRQIVDRCINGDVGSLTLNEVDLMANCWELLHVRNAGEDGARLRKMISSAIGQISTRFSRYFETVRRLAT